MLPDPLADWLRHYTRPLRVQREFRADAKRFSSYACFDERISQSMTPTALEALTIKDYHRIEKGLSLPIPKRPFGTAVSQRLDAALPMLLPGTDIEQSARTARDALRRWNDDGVIDDEVSPLVDHTPSSFAYGDVERFFTSRHSVREFDPERPVSQEDLLLATSLAGRSPSVCNRQATRVRFAVNDVSKNTLLSFQNGNSGFGFIPVVALITSDVRLFTGADERNQAWIDGGIFAQSLVLALHGLGLASCMLNMSLSNSAADSLRTAMSIGAHELLITQVAIGYPSRVHRRARSPRRAIREIASII